MNPLDRWLGAQSFDGLNWKGRAIERALLVRRRLSTGTVLAIGGVVVAAGFAASRIASRNGAAKLAASRALDRWLGAGLNWKGRAIERALLMRRRLSTGTVLAIGGVVVAAGFAASRIASRNGAAKLAASRASADSNEAAAVKNAASGTSASSPKSRPESRIWQADPNPPRRILHLGNILNNGYLNAKFLRRFGWSVDSVTIDYRHVQAQPEWEEVRVINPTLSQFDPDWSTIPLGGYQRVSWFHDVAQADIKRLAAGIKDQQQGGLTSGPARSTASSVARSFDIRSLARATLNRVGLLSPYRAAVRAARVVAEHASSDAESQLLVDEYARVFPGHAQRLTLSDIAEARPTAANRAPLFELYPLVQAYSLDPIYVMVNDPWQPLICFEHGTMREFPFENSARGRLYALALHRAERVFITNADCNRSAERLGLTNYTFVPHPVDENLYRPAESPLREALCREHNADVIFLAPARHHWKHCPPGLENSWLKRNDILIRALGRFFAERPQVRALVVFFEWGKEVEFSKALIAECGFADRVRWEPIASKPVMRDYYNAADIVFDQFNDGIGTFGTVVPESLASGKPVVLNYKEALHHWCFPELPPALNAPDEAAIVAHISRLLDNPTYRLELGKKGRDWFVRNHSSSLVAGRMIDVYLEIADRRGWKWRH